MKSIYFFFIVIIFLIISCAPDKKETAKQQSDAPSKAASPYAWSLLTREPGYSRTYNYQMFAVGDKAYVFHPDGVWESSDGRNWTATGLKDIIQSQDFLDYVVFNDAVYALGTFSGKLFSPNLSSQIARTTDFRTWEILSKKSNLPARFLYRPFVFQNKIWIIGGNNGETIFADAWNSADGIKWEKVADDLPFGAQDSQHFIVFKDQLYMMGPQDVWVSKDGIAWTMLPAQPGGERLSGYMPVVFDDKIWLIGSNRGGEQGRRVYYSEDGVKWTSEEAPWSARAMVAACTFKDQILITGGRYGGTEQVKPEMEYVNDVWAMRKK